MPQVANVMPIAPRKIWGMRLCFCTKSNIGREILASAHRPFDRHANLHYVGGPMNAFPDDLAHNLGSPLARLLLQILVILVVARVCGLLVRRLGQPQVIGEILAGILLGPSLFQLVAPGAHAFVFPEGSAQQLYFLSQVGILLFMFIVGLELDTTELRSRIASLLVVSGASVAIPFAMGVALALLLFSDYGPPDKGVL